MNAATPLPPAPEPLDPHERGISVGVIVAVAALLIVAAAVRAFPDETWPSCAEQGAAGAYLYRWRVDSTSTPVTRCGRPDAGLRVSLTPGAGAPGAAGAHYPSSRGSIPRPATTSRTR